MLPAAASFPAFSVRSWRRGGDGGGRRRGDLNPHQRRHADLINENGRDADGLDTNGSINIDGGTIRISLSGDGGNNAIACGSESGCAVSSRAATSSPAAVLR
jgi:hypothetical protein